jgi:acyl CoA:acetate/3-ketoacid CoA transferase beta subunit
MDPKELIAKRVAANSTDGDHRQPRHRQSRHWWPTISPPDVHIILHSGKVNGRRPRSGQGAADPDITNAGGKPVTILPGGAFFDARCRSRSSADGHVAATVLGALEVDEEATTWRIGWCRARSCPG